MLELNLKVDVKRLYSSKLYLFDTVLSLVNAVHSNYREILLAERDKIVEEAPKEEVVEAPKEEVVEAPKEEVVEAPKEEVVEAPKEEVVEAPKEEVVEEKPKKKKKKPVKKTKPNIKYDRNNEELKSRFIDLLADRVPKWKSCDASKAATKRISMELDGQDFLAPNREILGEFADRVVQAIEPYVSPDI